MALFVQDLGIDLGTANVLIYQVGKGIIVREPTVVAVRTDGAKDVVAVGEAAKQMLGRTPHNIRAVAPMHDGVIADFDNAQLMLRTLLHKAIGGRPLFRPRVVISVPCGVTTVERRAVAEAVRNAGARQVLIVDEPYVAAIGAGLAVDEPTGSMIVDIGGGTCEVAVLSMGGIVTVCSLRVAGNSLDEAIIQYMRREHDLVIGQRTAEEVKIDIGSALPIQKEIAMVRGRNAVTGLPQVAEITTKDIYEALREPIATIVGAVKGALERTPPEIAADIMQQGICLSGGGAALQNMDKFIQMETGMPVYVAQNPMDCVARGTGKLLENPQLLEKAVRASAEV